MKLKTNKISIKKSEEKIRNQNYKYHIKKKIYHKCGLNDEIKNNKDFYKRANNKNQK